MYLQVGHIRYSGTNPFVVGYLTTLYQREVEVKLSPTMPSRYIHALHQEGDLGTHGVGPTADRDIL